MIIVFLSKKMEQVRKKTLHKFKGIPIPIPEFILIIAC